MGAINEPLDTMKTEHYLATMDTQGDTRIQWHPDNPIEVEVARSAFERLTRAGYRAFFVNAEGGQGQPMTAFDPQAQAIVLVPRIVGG